jgi:putative Mg2+ transporter-C (MgtC) family protein
MLPTLPALPVIADLLLRLTLAVLLGAVIGLNREIKGKPAGLRTYSVVALGAAVVAALVTWPEGVPGAAHYDALSRVLQGLITGIGFLGAGVIVRGSGNAAGREDGAGKGRHPEHDVHGLTTAASIWLAACLGAACGAGAWLIALITFALVMAILLLGGPAERAALRRFKPAPESEPEDEAEREARQR